MENKWYRSKGIKALWIFLCHLGGVGMAVCLAWMVCYPAITQELLQNAGEAKQYEDSASFYYEMYSDSNHLLHALQYKDVFETKGKFDPEKIVDVEEFYNSSIVTGKNESGLAYRLGDLIDWGEKEVDLYQSYESEGERNPEQIIVCEGANGSYIYYPMSEFRKLITSKELQFIMADDTDGERYSTADILRRLEDFDGFDESTSEEYFKGIQDKEGKILYINCWSYDGTRLEERYAPLGADNLLQIVNENENWNGKLSVAVDRVAFAVEAIQDYYESYQSLGSQMEEEKTNFCYLYADHTNKKVLTNRKDLKGYKHLDENVETLKRLGKYLIVTSKSDEIDTNLSQDVSEWYYDAKTQLEGNSSENKDFILAMAVDASYPVQDVYSDQDSYYSAHIQDAPTMFALGSAGVVLFLIGMIWLILVAGRCSQDEELHLMGFDKVKTELAALLVIGGWAAGFGLMFVATVELLINRSYDYYGANSFVKNPQLFFLFIIIMALFTCAMFLIGLLSLIRRIKARQVWKNSILRLICRWIRKIFKKSREVSRTLLKNIRSLWKMMLAYGAFLIVQWIALGSHEDAWVFFSVIVDGIVLVYLLRRTLGMERLQEGIRKISNGEVDFKIKTEKMTVEHTQMAEGINSIGAGLDAAVEKSMKSERLKTDLITNVSHDIKTPLTSIINYVDLLKKEEFEDPKIQHYIEVLEQKSQRLKTLTEDVVEASKVSSGNIHLEYVNLNLIEMIRQVSGEFEEKFAARELKEVLNLPEKDAIIRADSRRMFRVLENIYNNVAKYAMTGSRVYADLEIKEEKVVFSLKNISEQPLNISADELTERFIRGDISRSTEGSGLGLSIAKSLTEMQGGKFELYLDGDLFKVVITFTKA